MKKILYSLVIILFISCSTAKNNTGSMSSGFNPVVAHRGAFKKNAFPENSLASLQEAIRLGCRGSEFDVRMTADDSLVINHDPEFHKLPIEKTTYKELTAFTLSNGEKFPTLRAYLLAGLQNNPGTTLVCEIKPSTISKERAKLIAERVYRLVTELKATGRVVYISFDYDILKKLLELNPKVITQFLDGNKTPAELKADGIKGADYHFSVFRKNPDWITEARKLGIVLNAWTVNEAADMNWLLDNGFDLITTNEPELLADIVKSRK
ncbi:glycerophosphodiester phosphodiesterase [Sediminibacterium soli]|uniref:glycerophosphodiester phosphodiesterase n=1 Tax=Sediminibacterium soli TaxID=2698829 RepID=UPI00137A1E14|nr:glycerophosphodiester phosphodiesterase family protein [Sediminibacterium soli]NCI47402.1 glycerophosphodiester phosphodiesterase [Sediminibacterium soli]